MAANVSTQAFNPNRLWLAALVAIGFGAGVIATAVAVPGLRPGPTASGENAAAVVRSASADEYATYQATLANLASAVARGDMASAAHFRTSLDGQLSSAVVASQYADHERILGNMAAAKARGDHRIYEEFKARLGALCPALGRPSVPSFCN